MKTIHPSLRDYQSISRKHFCETVEILGILGGWSYSSDKVMISITTSGSASGTITTEESAETVMNALSDRHLDFTIGFRRTYTGEEARILLRKIIFQIEFEEKNAKL